MNVNEKYLEFSSSLSFFEFIQEEFYNPEFDTKNYINEITVLEQVNSITEDELTILINRHPKVFDIFEQIFQSYRFTNTQLINFFFDINILNSIEDEKIIKSLNYNLEFDTNFKEIYNKNLKEVYLKKLNSKIQIKVFKESIVSFIEKSKKKREWIYFRLENDISTRKRVSSYLINNLKMNDIFCSVNLKEFLVNKRIQKDTKSIHGKFGTIKINNILNILGCINLDKECKDLKIKEIDNNLDTFQELEKYNNKWVVVTEKYVSNVMKQKQKKPKKFDFIILKNLKIKYLIETNFYSTSGTKIGINEEEYIDLNNEIKNKLPEVSFLWVTDGNYWLTKNGEERYIRNYESYFQENLLNYNLLKIRLEKQIN